MNQRYKKDAHINLNLRRLVNDLSRLFEVLSEVTKAAQTAYPVPGDTPRPASVDKLTTWYSIGTVILGGPLEGDPKVEGDLWNNMTWEDRPMKV